MGNDNFNKSKYMTTNAGKKELNFFERADGLQRSHKAGKAYFDPRKWNAAGRQSMSQRVVEYAQLLGSAHRAVRVSYPTTVGE